MKDLWLLYRFAPDYSGIQTIVIVATSENEARLLGTQYADSVLMMSDAADFVLPKASSAEVIGHALETDEVGTVKTTGRANG